MEETQIPPENQPPPPLPDHQYSKVDTSRPFRTVKEAVAIFGERFLAAEIYAPSPKPPFNLPKHETPVWKFTPPSNQTSWKSSESEEDPPPVLMNTLKKLESELEETKKELKMLKERGSETEVALASLNAELHKNMSKIAKAEAEVAGKAAVTRPSTTLGQVLSGGEEKERKLKERKVTKKKPVVPLVTDLFSRKKGKPKTSLLNPLYMSSHIF